MSNVLNLGLSSTRFIVHFADSAAAVRDSQLLRYRVFAQELGARIKGPLDHDEFDPYCQHLLVREPQSGRLIASTRILTEEAALQVGGFYSAGEFDLAMLNGLPGRLLEIGRTCVDPDYRSGPAIARLWQGLADYALSAGYDYLFGCASISLREGNDVSSLMARLPIVKDPSRRVQPLRPVPRSIEPLSTAPLRLPPLLKAYINLGAQVCGEAYWDEQFNCADVFVLLPVADLHPRYARRFGRASTAWNDPRKVA